MNAGLGVNPEAWLRMHAQEAERGLATRRLRDMQREPLRPRLRTRFVRLPAFVPTTAADDVSRRPGPLPAWAHLLAAQFLQGR